MAFRQLWIPAEHVSKQGGACNQTRSKEETIPIDADVSDVRPINESWRDILRRPILPVGIWVAMPGERAPSLHVARGIGIGIPLSHF